MDKMLLLTIAIPIIGAVASFLIPQRLNRAREIFALFAAALNLFLVITLFKNDITLSLPWAGFGFEFSLRLYRFSAFIILAISGFGFLITLYSTVFMRGRNFLRQFYAYLMLTLAFATAAVLADNLLVLLFFWEALLLTTFGMIYIGGASSFKTAIKAFIITGVADLCMMAGIVIAAHLAGTFTISRINLPLGSLGAAAFILLFIGSTAKAGCMPFHSWIPDASTDAPLPFMAILPASLEKLVGIYFLTRISLDIFSLTPESPLSFLLMIVGGATIILAVMMALIQKEYKRLLSYHAISQVGYMVLGIGTAIPAGIVGGLFHMINNALYKSGLFLTAGAVEKQTGTTDLEKLGGIGLRMPVTFVCFIVTALSISGVPPFNGFFSKELVYDGALKRGLIFYLCAAGGSFFTAASFLKLGHAVFLGRISEQNKSVKEAPALMIIPIVIIASACVIFGVFNFIPLEKLIRPSLGQDIFKGHAFFGMPNFKLTVVTLIILALAVLNHIFGVKKGGSGLKASEHIHHAPVLSAIYARAEKGLLDPYNIALRFVGVFAKIAWRCDRAIDFLYDVFSVRAAAFLSREIRKAHTGNYSSYLVWCLAGMLAVVLFLMFSL